MDAGGDVVAWPTLLMSHNEAFLALPHLRDNRARWRQWNPGEAVDFDPGVSAEDRAKVEAWIAADDSAELRVVAARMLQAASSVSGRTAVALDMPAGDFDGEPIRRDMAMLAARCGELRKALR